MIPQTPPSTGYFCVTNYCSDGGVSQTSACNRLHLISDALLVLLYSFQD